MREMKYLLEGILISLFLLVLNSCNPFSKKSESPVSDAVKQGHITEAVEIATDPHEGLTKAECVGLVEHDQPASSPSLNRGPASTSSSNNCDHNFYENKSVLYIGDSHSYLRSEDGQRMGNVVMDQLNDCGVSKISYHGVCGSRPSNWMPGKRPRSTCGVSSVDENGFRTSTRGEAQSIDKLIQNDTQVVMINLGDNMFNWKRSGSKRIAESPSVDRVAREVSRLIAQIPEEAECQWIGPVYHSPGSPYTKPNAQVDKLYEGITKGLGDRCELIDGRSFFSSTRANDGLHLTSSESTRWGEKIAEAIKSE